MICCGICCGRYLAQLDTATPEPTATTPTPRTTAASTVGAAGGGSDDEGSSVGGILVGICLVVAIAAALVFVVLRNNEANTNASKAEAGVRAAEDEPSLGLPPTNPWQEIASSAAARKRGVQINASGQCSRFRQLIYRYQGFALGVSVRRVNEIELTATLKY